MLNDKQYELMQQAVQFAIRTGFTIFPVVGKIPPQGFKWRIKGSAYEVDIEDMPWDIATGFAIDCGRSGLCVLDIDDMEATKHLQGWPDSTRQDTNKGVHYLYKAPPFRQGNTTGKPLRGVDIRGDGGYIVAWNPEQIINTIFGMQPWPKSEQIGKEKTELPETEVSEGTRNSSLASFLGEILASEPFTSFDVLIERAVGWNHIHCKVPLPFNEIKATTISIYTTAAQERPPIEQGEKFKLWSIKELLNRPVTDFLIDGLLPIGGVGQVYGAPGSGKTFVVLDWALKIATGEPIRGRQVVKSPIIYICMEGESGVPNRIQAAMDKHGIKDLPPEQFSVVVHPQPGILSSIPELKAQAIKIKEMGIKNPLVILDTFAAAYPGINENDSGQTQAAITCLKSFTRELGGSLMFVHHKGKGNSPGSRGSTAIEGACDLIVKITNSEGKRTAKAEKVKDGDCMFKYDFELESVQLNRFDRYGNQVRTAIVNEVELGREEGLTKPQITQLENVRTAINEGVENSVEKLSKHIGGHNWTRVRNYITVLGEIKALRIVNMGGIDIVELE